MLKTLLDGHPAKALLSGSMALVTVALGGTLTVHLGSQPAEEVPVHGVVELEQPTPLAAASWAVTPAERVLTATLSAPPKGWEADGEMQRGTAAPFPYSCPQEGISAATSVAQTYNAGGTRAQVIATAYTAGLGAEAMAKQRDNVAICAGGGNYASVNPIQDGPGSEAFVATTTKGSVRAAVASTRRGDIITYVVAGTSADATRLARDIDQTLEGALQGSCSQQDSTVSDAARSPWSTQPYVGLLADHSVSIPAVDLPTVPATEKTRAVEIPAPVEELQPALPVPPPPGPVWPEMPPVKPLPVAPTAPEPETRTEAVIQKTVEDTHGPGCGWNFTAMNAPIYDAETAKQALVISSAAAVKELQVNAQTWKDDVLNYWRNYAVYEQEAAAYRAYAKEVERVNEAWRNIQAQWDAYYADVDEYEAAKAAEEAFLAAQEQARREHEAETKRCEEAVRAAEKAEDEARKKPVPSPSPTPSPTPSPSPEEQPDEGCPADAPPILTEAPPAVPEAPKVPADPRPRS